MFQTTVPNFSMHIRNIYEEGKLAPEATIKKFLTVRLEGAREVRRELDFYNLDMMGRPSFTQYGIDHLERQ